MVEPAALAALLHEGGYGYDMRRSILEATEGALDVDAGGLYRALRRLEEEGAVASKWGEDASGPRRREYQVTEEGLQRAAQWVSILQERQRLDAALIALLESGLDLAGIDSEAGSGTRA